MPLDALAAIAAAPRPSAVVPAGEVVGWSSGPGEHKARAYRSGPYALRLSVASTSEAEGATPGTVVPFGRVTVSAFARESPPPVLTLTTPDGGMSTAHVRVVVARLDPASADYAVVVTGYTGGAHCCEDVQVAVPSGGGWTVLHPGAFDNAPLGFEGGGDATLKDMAGNGADELIIPDDRFDYVFGCFACSYQPIRIYGLRGKALVDRTSEPAFRPVLEADMRKAQAACREPEPGACPGYLADAARLGRWEEGWRVLKASVPARPAPGYPDQLCGGVRVAYKCLAGEAAQPIPDYATSVRLFLRWRGYPVPASG